MSAEGSPHSFSLCKLSQCLNSLPAALSPPPATSNDFELRAYGHFEIIQIILRCSYQVEMPKYLGFSCSHDPSTLLRSLRTVSNSDEHATRIRICSESSRLRCLYLSNFGPSYLKSSLCSRGLVVGCNHSFTVATNDQESSIRSPDGSNTVFGFQCNERYLEWDDSAARQLIKIYIAEELDTDLEFVNGKLLELSAVIPTIVNRIDKLKAQLVLDLVKDTDAVANRMIALTAALPGVNVAQMVSGNFWLLKEPSSEYLRGKLQKMKELMPDIDVERVIESEPRLLMADIEGVLSELNRLMPSVTNPASLVATHASMVLGMKNAGLPASLLIDDGIQAE